MQQVDCLPCALHAVLIAVRQYVAFKKLSGTRAALGVLHAHTSALSLLQLCEHYY
jgi:hypothetical protein